MYIYIYAYIYIRIYNTYVLRYTIYTVDQTITDTFIECRSCMYYYYYY